MDRYRTQYIEAKAKLGYSNLRSPSAGTVADVKVKVGDVIQQGQVFTSLVQNDELEAKVEVPAIFRPGCRRASRFADGPGSEEILATGVLESIDPRINPNTQGLLVMAVFPNSDGTLRDGLRLHTRVQINAEEQLAVPFAAVTQTSGQSFVFRLGSFDELRGEPWQGGFKAGAGHQGRQASRERAIRLTDASHGGRAAEQPVSHYQGPEAESEGGHHQPAEPQTRDACAGATRQGELRLIDVCFQ